MKYDEFAFFNQQLAAMLREGIPLEGALRQLAQGMSRGTLRQEMEKLGADLSAGVPLKEALARGQLPPLYARMLEIGARSNDLPAMLTLLADHYHRTNSLWTRLKGLLLYPVMVIGLSLCLTVVLCVLSNRIYSLFGRELYHMPAVLILTLWAPPVCLAIAALFVIMVFASRRLRDKLRWRLPAFREASLAQLASAMALMIERGATLSEALSLAEGLEPNTAAATSLAQWRAQIEAGSGSPARWQAASFPPLFLWLIQSAGENVAGGFRKAANLYQARAAYKTDLALYGALPISILFVGQFVFWQLVPLFRALAGTVEVLTNPLF
jgi:type II secretory pathway component PulF